MAVPEAQMPTALTHAHELSTINNQLIDGERVGGVIVADRRPTDLEDIVIPVLLS